MLYSSHSLLCLGTINVSCLYIRFEAAQIRRGRFQMLTSPWGLQENSPVLCEDGRVLCTVGVTYREVETADLSHGIARMARRSQNDPSAPRQLCGRRVLFRARPGRSWTVARRRRLHTQCARAATSAIASAGMVLRQQSGAVSARALLGLGVVE